MGMEPQQAKLLIQKYLRDDCTETERALVESWHIEDLRKHTDHPAAERTEAVFEALRPQLLAYAGKHRVLGTGSVHRQSTRRHLRHWLPYAAAAVLVLASLVGGWWYLNTPVSDPILVSDDTNDVAPGSNRAVLRLD